MQPETELPLSDDDSVAVQKRKDTNTLSRLTYANIHEPTPISRLNLTKPLLECVCNNRSKEASLVAIISQFTKESDKLKAVNYALRVAVSARCHEHLPTLVRYGADLLNAGTETGNIAMHTAMQFADVASIKTLLELGVQQDDQNPLAQLSYRNKLGVSPLDLMRLHPIDMRLSLCISMMKNQAWLLALSIDGERTSQLSEFFRDICTRQEEEIPTKAPGSI